MNLRNAFLSAFILIAATAFIFVSRAVSREGGSEEVYPDEYDSFYVVPQVALNYDASRLYDEITDLASSAGTDWVSLDSGDFTREVQYDDEHMLRVNDDLTDWEHILVNDELRKHIRVTQMDGYVHTRVFMWHAGGSGLYDADSEGGVVIFDEFAAITVKDEEDLQRTLGKKIFEHAEIEAPIAGDDYAVEDGIDAEIVGAFDSEHLMIRPDVISNPLMIDAGEQGYLESETYPDSQGETFDAPLFPELDGVEALMEKGFSPEFIAKAKIYENFTYDYEFVDWTPSDIGF
ncbi:MAG: hypothetical protein PQJ61_13510 [Spirochaetales bacterium]|uniref:Uncharacterized protein n=1 Tax=Candidatus Thalassospirochaeta sargassi TaxID=3119039 RepID=A0AAJ1MLD4_9SPIO|nr:hypothetical protein [Spirochaetales bacterium]